jgi:multiple sugar transport system permease protein
MRIVTSGHAPPARAGGTRGRRAVARLQHVEILFTYVLLGLFCLFALFPLFWALSTSVKVNADILRWPPTFFPRALTFEHYVSVFTVKGLPRALLNSALVALLTIGLTLVTACPLAYVTAHFEFRLKRQLLFLILATAMVPSISVLLPLYLIAQRLALIDTYTVLVLIYSAAMTPQVVWVLRGFFLTIAPDLEQAARIDGCSRFTAFWHVILPLARPGLAAASMLVFVYVWNDFLITVSMTSSDSMRMIQVGLAKLISDVGVSWSDYTAYTVAITLPPIVAFLALQRRFLQSLMSGALKG